MTVRILLLEDVWADAELVKVELRKAGLQFTARRVAAQPDLERARREFRPDVVVTSSEAEEDIARSYRVNANAYVTKPIDPAVFLKAGNAIGAFWLKIVRLP